VAKLAALYPYKSADRRRDVLALASEYPELLLRVAAYADDPAVKKARRLPDVWLRPRPPDAAPGRGAGSEEGAEERRAAGLAALGRRTAPARRAAARRGLRAKPSPLPPSLPSNPPGRA
jgi:hypothetical protein